MPAAATDVSTLNIHRLHACYLVPSDHPAPEAVRAKLDGIARRELRDAVAAAVSRSLPDSATDIWLIRSLKLEVDLNLDVSEQQSALTWAKQTATSLATILEGHADANEVLHFPDRAAYLARFLLDLVEGSAWDKWYYRRFEGLRPLPLSTALRTAICHQPASGRDALLQMSEPCLRKILATLTDHDAKRFLNEIAVQDSNSDHTPISQHLNPWLLHQPALFENDNCSALSLYLRICSEHPSIAGPGLKAFVVAVACFLRCMRDGSPARSMRLLRALTRNDVASLYQSAGPADAERLTPLLGRTAEWLQAVAKPQAASQESGHIDGPRHTTAGGIFLLLPLLDKMPIPEATRDWTGMCDCAPASLVRWLLLMKCSGTSGAAHVFHDPLTRDLLAIAPQMDSTSLRKWQTSLSLKQLFSLQNQIARWQMDNSTDSQRSITLVVCRKQRSLLCSDCQTRSLLLALPDSHSSRELLLDTVSAWPANPAMQQSSSADQLLGPPMDETHLQQIGDDLDFLKLPPGLRGPRRSELAFGVAARALLRNFSWRLPGFSQSGAEYLHRNFLDLHASLQIQSAQRTVRLSHPPLQVVLSLSGMTSQRYDLSWSEETFALFPE